MRGAPGGPFGEPEGKERAPSRRHTPSMGLAPPESDAPDEAANEDFLFHLYRGSELLQDNRAHEAKEELERALHLQPHDTKGQDLLAVVYFRLGLYPRAISIYEQLRRTSPRDPALLLNLALCYLKTGQAALARRDLEQLLTINPQHARAWGYLGLACERVGALDDAQRAFEHGGHGQMARRIADRRVSQAPPPPLPEESSPSREVREVVAAAFEELDAGELSFALAEQVSDSSEQKERGSADSWRPVELGHMSRVRSDGSPTSSSRSAAPPEARHDADSKKPDTKDGPPVPRVAPIPQIGAPVSMGRRPTLMVGVPPPHDPAELEALSRLPSPRPPAFVLDDAGMPSLSRPGAVVVPSVRAHGAGTNVDGTAWTDVPPSKRTLPPPSLPPPQPSRQAAPAPVAASPAAAGQPAAPPVSSGAASVPLNSQTHSNLLSQQFAQQPMPPRMVTSPPPAGELTRNSIVAFPASGNVLLHPSGVALVRTAPVTGFAARLEALRASSNALSMKLLERQVKGKSTGESFGGVGSPLVHATGEGQLVLAPRPGRKLSSFMLDGAAPTSAGARSAQDDDMCFVREEVLLGFDGELVFENGRLATGEGEFVAVVQLRGRGAVVLEAIGEILTLEVQGNRGISVRREVVLGWFGRLVPRALAPSEAPCGQRGLVSFAGEGRVLVASA